MAKAFKCDVSGKVVEGEPKTSGLVRIKGGAAFIITPQRANGQNAFTQGEVTTEVIDQAAKALQSAFGAPDDAPAKK
jgi:hypothetical protein